MISQMGRWEGWMGNRDFPLPTYQFTWYMRSLANVVSDVDVANKRQEHTWSLFSIQSVYTVYFYRTMLRTPLFLTMNSRLLETLRLSFKDQRWSMNMAPPRWMVQSHQTAFKISVSCLSDGKSTSDIMFIAGAPFPWIVMTESSTGMAKSSCLIGVVVFGK